jgi:hypothetical protein
MPVRQMAAFGGRNTVNSLHDMRIFLSCSNFCNHPICCCCFSHHCTLMHPYVKATSYNIEKAQSRINADLGTCTCRISRRRCSTARSNSDPQTLAVLRAPFYEKPIPCQPNKRFTLSASPQESSMKSGWQAQYDIFEDGAHQIKRLAHYRL